MFDVAGLVAVFVAGTLTALTPCCLPMIPPLLAGSTGHRLRPIAIVAGSIISFTTLGIITSLLSSVTPETLRVPFVVLIIAFGAIMADDDLHDAYTTATSRITGPASRVTRAVENTQHPLVSGVVLGLFLGIIWLPCVGPVLGSVVAYGGKRASTLLTNRVRSLERPALIRRVSGYALVVTGIGLLFELDKAILA